MHHSPAAVAPCNTCGMNAPHRRGIPLRADPMVRAEVALRSLATALVARARGTLTKRPATDIVEELGDDPGALYILRGIKDPLSTSSGDALTATLISDLLPALGTVSAAAQLFAASLRLNFDRHVAIALPYLIADPGDVGFVGEGQPIPVRQLSVTAGQRLEPRSLKVAVELTQEMVDGSNAVSLVTDTLKRSTALALDVALFGNVAGDDVRPPGLRYGIAATTASTAADATTAMVDDIAALAGSVAVVNGTASPIFVAAPARAITLMMRAPRALPFTVLASSAVAAGDLICVGPQALAVAFGDRPEIVESRVALLHEDSVPTAIVPSGGSPASPLRSLFQTDSVGMRLKLPAAWVLRDARGLAWTTTTAW